MHFSTLTWLVPLLPLIGFLINFLFFRNNRHVAPLIAFFNAQENRDYFATVIFDEHHLDGSSLSITVRQQGFSMTLATLHPFSEKSDSTLREFSELARVLIKKSGLVLSGKEFQ